jgi:hypothetical protein
VARRRPAVVELVTRAEYARRCGVSRTQVQRWLEQKMDGFHERTHPVSECLKVLRERERARPLTADEMEARARLLEYQARGLASAPLSALADLNL